MNPKKWLIWFFSCFLIGIILIATFNIVIDPFFHFHAPLRSLQYPMKDERYLNDGIQRHFDYEILLIGTSEAQNFNTSVFEELSGKKAVKTCYSGASFHELGENIRRAIDYNENLKTVICSFDPNSLSDNAAEDNYEDYPTYLYDKNIFNDIKYVLNKTVVTKSIAVLNYTRSGQKTPTFDEYGRFDIFYPTGKEAVFKTIGTPDETRYDLVFTSDDEAVIEENISSNFLTLADDYPEVQFVFFIPPYSYCHWEALNRTGQVDYAVDALTFATGLLLTRDNVKIYSFADREEIVTDLDYYIDTIHYNGVVCDMMSRAIFNEDDEALLDRNTYKSYFNEVKNLYEEMDYDSLNLRSETHE